MAESIESEQAKQENSNQWWIYILRCRDGSLYTGITLDVNRRLQQHRGELGAKKGAKSLRGKTPLTLVFSQPQESRSAALKLEYKIKRLSKPSKEALVANTLTTAELLD